MSPAATNIHTANLRAPFFFVAQARVRCRQCACATRVAALALPRSHETAEAEEDLAAPAQTWQRTGVNALLFFVGDISDVAEKAMTRAAGGFRLTPTSEAFNPYWANHCESCGLFLGDHELHCEPGGAFVPTNMQAAREIQLLLIPESIQVLADGYTFEPEFFRYMTKG